MAPHCNNCLIIVALACLCFANCHFQSPGFYQGNENVYTTYGGGYANDTLVIHGARTGRNSRKMARIIRNDGNNFRNFALGPREISGEERLDYDMERVGGKGAEIQNGFERPFTIDLSKRSIITNGSGPVHGQPMAHVMLDFPDINFWKKLSELPIRQFLEKVSIRTLAKSRYSNVRSYQTAQTESKADKAEFRSKKSNFTESEPLFKIPKIHDAELVFSEHASCKPRIACVEVDDSILHNRVKKHGIMYYPACLEIERCNGCCLHTCLKCDPIAVSPKQFTIMEIDVSFNEYGPVLKYSRSLSITLDNHDKCECQCNMDIESCRVTYCI